MKKRILSAILAVIVATSSFSAVAYAEKVSPVAYAPDIYHEPSEEFTQGNFIFAPVVDGNMYVVGLVDRTVSEITIPSSVNGRRLTIIDGGAFARCPNLTSVYIPDDVLCIGESAFSGCEKLKSVRLPDSITSIDMYAFAGCTSLQEITLSSHLVSLGLKAFDGCKNLKTIYFPETKDRFRMASENGLYEAGLKKDDPYWQIFDGTITYFNGTELVDTKATIHYNTSSPSQTVNPDTGSSIPNTSTTTDPRLALALDKAKYALSLAEENLRKANVALTNARKKTSYVFDGNGFVQVADTNAIREAELDVQRAELTYREAELNYQQIQALINNSTSSVYGDVDGDGKLTVLDISRFLKLCIENTAYSQKYDFNNDGKINILDVSILLNACVNS